MQSIYIVHYTSTHVHIYEAIAIYESHIKHQHLYPSSNSYRRSLESRLCSQPILIKAKLSQVTRLLWAIQILRTLYCIMHDSKFIGAH